MFNDQVTVVGRTKVFVTLLCWRVQFENLDVSDKPKEVATLYCRQCVYFKEEQRFLQHCVGGKQLWERCVDKHGLIPN